MTRPAALFTLVGALAGGAACEEAPACEEDIRAQVIEERVAVEVGGATVLAELADDAVERDRGWKHRVCEREGILLVPDEPGTPLAVWGCGLVEAVDAVFIVDGSIAAIERVEACAEPCGRCVVVGEGVEVDAVLELPSAGLARELAVGDPVGLSL